MLVLSKCYLTSVIRLRVQELYLLPLINRWKESGLYMYRAGQIKRARGKNYSEFICTKYLRTHQRIERKGVSKVRFIISMKHNVGEIVDKNFLTPYFLFAASIKLRQKFKWKKLSKWKNLKQSESSWWNHFQKRGLARFYSIPALST